MGNYIPRTTWEQQDMLLSIGAKTFQDLYKDIPEGVLLKSPLNIPDGLSEYEVKKCMTKFAGNNVIYPSIFRGCGAYNHYIPSIVKQITSKEEFMTAYTPYQGEISQGTLQAIFEFQTMICELTGMEAANASVYDGASAAAEAVIMCKDRKRDKILISETVDPQIIKTVETYCADSKLTIVKIPDINGVTDHSQLVDLLDDKVAGILIQQPNFYGQLEDCEGIGKLSKQYGAKFIMSCNPISLAILKTPGECFADIAVGEGQPLGIPLSFGGPYLGFMATTKELMRKLPGRIAGETTDSKGNRAYVLTLQAREQHIRREKASSSICSNQTLCALTASVYLSTMGKEGLIKAAKLSMSKAHYLANELSKVEGFDIAFLGEFFNEFVTGYTKDIQRLMKKLESHGILGGLPVVINGSNKIIWCATEMNTKAEMDELIKVVKEVTEDEANI